MAIGTPDLIDKDETLRQLVIKMVADEASEFQAQPEDIELPARPFLTQRLRNELIRWEQNEPQSRLADITKIRNDNPPPVSDELNEDELESWLRCLDQLKIKLEYRQKQLTSIEILKAYDKPAWDQYLSGVESTALKSQPSDNVR